MYRTFFFFSSRRRHTRSLRDWSSDVCSSDLGPVPSAFGGTPVFAHAAMASAWVLTAPLIADGALPSRPWAALAAWEMSDFVGLSCSPANLTLIVWSWLQKSAAELPPPPLQALIVAAVPAAASKSVALRQFRVMVVIMMGPPSRCSNPHRTQCSCSPRSRGPA